MNEQEIIKEFVRVEKKPTRVEFHVCEISWEGPATPCATWNLVSQITGNPDEHRVNAEIARILADKHYFEKCQECGELNPLGWMHDEKICQSCAERNHGVVY